MHIAAPISARPVGELHAGRAAAKWKALVFAVHDLPAGAIDTQVDHKFESREHGR